MSKHYERDVDELHDRLLSVFGIVEHMIESAAKALFQNDPALVEEVLSTDAQVDEQEVLIEEECLKVLALHQPVACQLRRIATVLKINNDLERIADLACNIAERANCLHQYPVFPIPVGLGKMVSEAIAMVRQTLDAFVGSDVVMANAVIRRDEIVDQLNREVITQLIKTMQSDPSLIDPGTHCFSAWRHLERIADLAENIAEDVIYLVDGDIVRHRHDRLDELAEPDAE